MTAPLSSASDHVEVIRSPDQSLRQRAEDLERIATDLHDDIISNLAAIGVGLDAMAPRLCPVERARAETYVDALNETIRQLQSTIFRIQTPVSASADPLKFRLLNVLDEQTIRHPLDVGIEFVGALDHDLGIATENDLVAVVRDALRTAQLARASSVQVTVTSQPSAVVVQVCDNRPCPGGPGREPATWTYPVRVAAVQASSAAS